MDVPGCLIVSPGEIQGVEGYRIWRVGVPWGRAHCAEDMAVNRMSEMSVFMMSTVYTNIGRNLHRSTTCLLEEPET